MTPVPPAPASDRLTLVTGLFDLARREAGSQRPTCRDYLAWGEFVLGLDCNIVFYVDPELEPEVRARRAAHSLLHRTRVVAVALEDLPAHQLLDAITQARRRHPLINGDAAKDTPLHAILTWSKFELVRRTIDADPFMATHFAWIDFGLAKVARTEHAVADGVFTRPGDRVRMLMLRAPIALELADRDHYLSYVWGQLAGGYVSADRASFAELCELVTGEAIASLDRGYAATDEQLLVLVHSAQPDLFAFHHGDYEDILANYHRVRGSAANLLDQLRQCRSREQWDRSRAREIAEGVVRACRAGTFECDSRLLPGLLEECLLAVYFADYPRAQAARGVIQLYEEMARSDLEFREVFLRNEIRVRTNFASLSGAVAQ
jgi:hypothetical protein